jgi:hypothetical protein
MTQQVSIQPNVGMLSLFPHMKYQPWYALGELVDNSIQSYVANRDRLHSLYDDRGQRYRLRIDIETDRHDGGRIVVRDNAAGIAATDFQRAFRVAEPPADVSGLSQFGVGMKAAAAWFAKEFRVRSSSLGESVIRTVGFDIPAIVAARRETLDVAEEATDSTTHFTEVTLWNLNRVPKTRTVGKIREYLGSIYREFLRNGDVVILFDGEPIQYDEPAELTASRWSQPDEPPLAWRKTVDIHLESGRRVTGWAALRETGATSQAGMALLYRRKVVQGAGGDAYKPVEVFGRSNSFRSQRLFGELSMDDFDVTYTKDALVWYDEEEEFVELLRDQLDAEPLPLLRQAENYRARKPAPVPAEVATGVLQTTATVLDHADLTSLLGLGQGLDDAEADGAERGTVATAPGVEQLHAGEPLPDLANRDVVLTVAGRTWDVALRLIADEAVEPWLQVDRDDNGPASTLRLTVNQAHPFMRTFAEIPGQDLEPVWRLAVALGLAQELARDSGDAKAGYVRLNVNELLRTYLSKQP